MSVELHVSVLLSHAMKWECALQWAKHSLQLWYMTVLVSIVCVCVHCLVNKAASHSLTLLHLKTLYLTFVRFSQSCAFVLICLKICFLVEPDARWLNLMQNQLQSNAPCSSSSELLWPHPRPQKEWKITQGPYSHKKHLGSARGVPISSSKYLFCTELVVHWLTFKSSNYFFSFVFF